MFWNAVRAGLSMFLHWETYVAMLEASLILLIPLVLHKRLWLKTFIATGTARAIGRASLWFLALIQTFAMVVFVLSLSPLILGLHDHAVWLLPWYLVVASPLNTLVFLAFATFISALMGYIPVVGRMQAMVAFVVGSLCLMWTVRIVTEGTSAFAQVQFWPGLLFVLALLAVSAALALAGLFVVAGASLLIDQVWEGVGGLLFLPFTLPFSFLPVFIYGAWLAEQLH